MISIFYETNFFIEDEPVWKDWIESSVKREGFETEDVNYIFCDDEYLLEINRQYLQHDYYTDVIGFQYSEDRLLSGDIYISVERIAENAENHQKSFDNELARVMIHGILHFMNYRDKTAKEAEEMRKMEEKYLSIFEKII